MVARFGEGGPPPSLPQASSPLHTWQVPTRAQLGQMPMVPINPTDRATAAALASSTNELTQMFPALNESLMGQVRLPHGGMTQPPPQQPPPAHPAVLHPTSMPVTRFDPSPHVHSSGPLPLCTPSVHT